MKLRHITLVGLIALGGCAHEVVLTPSDGVGQIGKGTAPATAVASHGSMTVDLEGKHYAGEWTLQAGDAYVGTGLGAAGGKLATGTVYGANMTGGGRAYLTESGGGSISCGFSYNSMSYTGLGECRTAGGKVYNMMIH